jgi:two-component system, OmpR family, sensor histidine kinase BaeS
LCCQFHSLAIAITLQPVIPLSEVADMRLRLWHRLFAVQAILVLCAIIAMIVLQRSRLESGLLSYVDRLEVAKAQAIADLALAEYRDAGGFARMRARPPRIGRLIEAGIENLPFEELDNLRPRPVLDDRPPRQGDGRPPRPGDDHPPPFDDRRLPPRPNGLDFPSRIGLFDEAAQPIAGMPDRRPTDHRFPLLVDSKQVGELRLARLPALNTEWDRDFVRDQLRASVIVGVVILLVALVFSIIFARYLASPLQRLSKTAERMADGDFAARSGLVRSDEIGDLAGAFDRTAQTLQENRDARQRWTADISHELRTPVTILRGEIQAMEDGVRKLDRTALISLSSEVERLTHLINDLYQLSLSDIGALDYQFATVDLQKIVSSAVSASSTAMQMAGLTLQWQSRVAVAMVRGDETRLHQLFMNLFSNSKNYTNRGGVVRAELLALTCGFLLIVEDSAPGVPTEYLTKLTDPLFRVDASRSRAHGGAGLGLAIAKLIVEAHGAGMRFLPSSLGGLRIEIEFGAAG